MRRVHKEKHLKDVGGLFTKFGSFVLANFYSMTAGDFTLLRKKLKAEGCGVIVLKNSIARIALGESEKKELSGKLRGPVFMAYSEDVIVVSKVVSAFMKSCGNKVSLLCAYDNGKVLGADRVKFFASLPSLRELHARIVGLIGYGLPLRLANCLRALGDKG